MSEPTDSEPESPRNTAAADALAGVRGLLERAGDREAAFELVAKVVAERLGPGIAVWLGNPPAPDAAYPIEASCDLSGCVQPSPDPFVAAGGLAAGAGVLTGGLEQVRAAFVALPTKRADPALGGGLRFASMLTVPMLSCGGQLGWFRYLGCERQTLEPAGLEALGLLINLFSSQLANYRYVRELKRAKDWIDQEIAKIAAIQHALLPEQRPPIAGLDVAVCFRAYGHAGGDYYDLVPLPEIGERLHGSRASPRWGVILADASGHGASAAVEVAMLDAILRTYPGPADGPAAVLAYANRHLFTRRLRGIFITAFAANYSRDRATLTYASAGHHPTLLRRAGEGGAVERLDRGGGVPLLVRRDATWQDQAVSLTTGDLLVLYTDGITETRDRAGEEFGIERLERVVGGAPPDPQGVVNAIVGASDAFRAGLEPRDDQTVVVLQITSPAAG